MRRWLVLFGFGILILGQGASQAQTTEQTAPYIYYFSYEQHAIVVERADGSDSHLLGQGVIEETTETLTGPGWSPTGRWLAVVPSVGGFGQQAVTPLVLSVDGQRVVRLPTGYQVQWEWAPQDDVLLVSDDGQGEQPTSTFRTYLFDVGAERIVTLVEQPNVVTFTGSRYQSRWVENGAAALVLFEGYTDAEVSPDSYVLIFSRLERDGTSRQFDDYDPNELLWARPFTSPDGMVAFERDDQLVLENLVTGEQQTYTWPQSIAYVLWERQGGYALAVGEDSASVGLIDLQNASLTRLVDGMQWDVVSWENLFGYLPQEGFDRDLLYWASASQQVLYHWDWTTQQVQLVARPLPDMFGGVWWDWQAGAVVIEGEWQEPKEVWTWRNVYFLDLRTSEIQHLTTRRENNIEAYDDLYGVSPDARYVSSAQPYTIVQDRLEGTTIAIRPHSRSDLAKYAALRGETDWHPSGDWLLIAEESAITDSPSGARWMGIVATDTWTYRELPYCLGICAQWLPAQVAVPALPPAVPLHKRLPPHTVLETGDWSRRLLWSPDGRQLAVQLWTSGQVWDIDTATVIAEFTDTVVEEEGQWGVVDGVLVTPSLREQPARTLVSPDGRQVYHTDGTVVDTQTGVLLHQFDQPSGLVVFSPDSRYAFHLSDDTLWDTQTWQRRATLPMGVQQVAFSPTGVDLAVGSSWYIYVWSVEDLMAFYGEDVP